ncbi:protein kinase [Streptomyces sp. NPDC048258]|uniref:protein kinase domain-containing protein n=1 Tax=Streptomyces sp. NPDC048258 TaxID=3365527 RepID=UPI003715377F
MTYQTPSSGQNALLGRVADRPPFPGRLARPGPTPEPRRQEEPRNSLPCGYPLLPGRFPRLLHPAGAAGLVHRDLKPGNVLMAADGPRLIDFGIAKALEPSPTLTTLTGDHVIGTPGFMSPEQITGAPVGPASDIFSLGAVLLYAATGRAPFGHGTVQTLLYRVVHQEPDLSAAPAGLRRFLARCLAKDPAQRPTTDEVITILINAPDTAPPAPPKPVPGNSAPTAPATVDDGASELFSLTTKGPADMPSGCVGVAFLASVAGLFGVGMWIATSLDVRDNAWVLWLVGMLLLFPSTPPRNLCTRPQRARWMSSFRSTGRGYGFAAVRPYGPSSGTTWDRSRWAIRPSAAVPGGCSWRTRTRRLPSGSHPSHSACLPEVLPCDSH